MENKKLKEILNWHDIWLRSNYKEGERADLSGAYLSRAYLSRADLSEANLSRADLSGANLSRADLSRADLSEANLSRAYLSRADLSGADLSGAYLSGAVLPSGKKYIPITKEERIKLHKEVWGYLKEEKSFDKNDWGKWPEYYEKWPELRGMQCFLCVYFKLDCSKCVLKPLCDSPGSAWKDFEEKKEGSWDRIIKAADSLLEGGE